MRLLIGRDDLAEAVLAAGDGCKPAVAIERVDARPVHRGFDAFVNGGAIDIAEIALVTLLQAVADGRPLGLLPVTVLGRFQHHTLVSCRGLAISELEGATIGVRAWTQTTGVWVRGALAEQYGIDLRRIDWVTYEGGHVAGYLDPSWTRRAADGARLVSDLTSGRLDAAIIGNDLPLGTAARAVLDEPHKAARRWASHAGCMPVNHVVGVTHAAIAARPELIRAAYQALRSATAGDALAPSGFEALGRACAKAASYALDQEILTKVSLDPLLARTRALLEPSSEA
jgi:4,5-dihydroxyphthalate decarboxylase